MTNSQSFPSGFVWGVATSAYQIEGAHDADGRSFSIWDSFSRKPGAVADGDTGDRACEHYYRYPEDVKLMAELGIRHYRFSVSWPRIHPAEGQTSREGLAFYRSLLDELKRHGIEPLVTIYHWDLPQWIEDEGGWANRRTVERFERFADVLFREFGADVPKWITINEPWCAAMLGYGTGEHAPGKTDWGEAIRASHHLLLAHGKVVRAYRKLGLKGEIGITLNLDSNEPLTDAEEDRKAQVRHDGYMNRWFLDPIFKGGYPEDMMEWYRPWVGEFDFIEPGDLETIREPGDFFGINYYNRNLVKAGDRQLLLKVDYEVPPDSEVTDMGWEVHPESLYRLLVRLRDDYTSLPIYVTENGAAAADKLEDGAVRDEPRIRYVKAHLEQCLRFAREGGRLAGYYLWSFLDNFEWAWGYAKRFGAVYVDYETLERTPKDSAIWYGKVARSGVLPP